MGKSQSRSETVAFRVSSRAWLGREADRRTRGDLFRILSCDVRPPTRRRSATRMSSAMPAPIQRPSQMAAAMGMYRAIEKNEKFRRGAARHARCPTCAYRQEGTALARSCPRMVKGLEDAGAQIGRRRHNFRRRPLCSRHKFCGSCHADRALCERRAAKGDTLNWHPEDAHAAKCVL